ncbi:UNVERIFIED_CONTAM: hypothetical protein Sradi_3103100 [Sesamum radiatum]|uniref:Hydroxyproline-rich glycoprotein family protein n=1 Tax=Sesamum radiatum TaxID=300843 RepID=A0AAW2RCW7_SESRA
MESPYHAPVAHGGASRPSLGFPLGTALLLVVIFSLSGIFSCCYHWDKLRRSLSLHAADLEADGFEAEGEPEFAGYNAGDNVPRFIALPCPCEPPRPGNIAVQVEMPPPKPPRIAVPLY